MSIPQSPLPLLPLPLLLLLAPLLACGSNVVGGGDATNTGGGAPTSSGSGGAGTGASGGASTGGAGGMPGDLPCTAYVDSEPFFVSPYVKCARGLFEVSDYEEVGWLGFRGYAQFYTVYKESQSVWDQVILDPPEGVDDCWVLDQGNFGTGEGEQVVFENTGEATFSGPDFGLTVTEGPGFQIGYEVLLGELGYSPVAGGTYGIETTGNEAGDVSLPSEITMPGLPDLVSPPVGGNGVDTSSPLSLTWNPQGNGAHLGWGTAVDLPNGRRLIVRCTMIDDGAFVIPASVLQHLPAPVSADVWVDYSRRDVAMLDDFHGIFVQVGRGVPVGQWTFQ